MTQKIYLQAAAQIELKEASKEHPMFHSAHEAWAVTKEEIDECEYEMCGMQCAMQSMWEDVKNDEPMGDSVQALQDMAYRLAAEAIQVAAMCEKTMKYEELQNIAKDC
jgi:hypothetical protein